MGMDIHNAPRKVACAMCGTTFTTYGPRAKYCAECHDKLNSKRVGEYRKAHKNKPKTYNVDSYLPKRNVRAELATEYKREHINRSLRREQDNVLNFTVRVIKREER